ncbi:protein of unknown function (plasmid) [Cupriavidus taiwanensis]|nr:protein of unknown function [Cupriavidus taiwanensis]
MSLACSCASAWHLCPNLGQHQLCMPTPLRSSRMQVNNLFCFLLREPWYMQLSRLGTLCRPNTLQSHAGKAALEAAEILSK